jgi:hypothetical protein
MKKLLFIISLLTIFSISYSKEIKDSLDVGSISGTDTVIVINRSVINFGTSWGIEIEYTDLDADDATFDLGCRIGVEKVNTSEFVDSTFNSYNDILGISLPVTLAASTDKDSYYDTATKLFERPDKFIGRQLLIKITKGSVTSGYLRYTIWGF